MARRPLSNPRGRVRDKILMGQTGPVGGKYHCRQYKSENHVDCDATGEGPERFRAGGGEFSEAGSESNAEEAEDEGPSPQSRDGVNQQRFNDFVVVGEGKMAGYYGHNDRCQGKA